MLFMVDERDHNSNWRRRVSVRLSFFLMKNGGEFNLTSGSGGAPPTSGPLLAPVSPFLPPPFIELLFARSDD